jgi:hypothetical protein
MKTRALALTVGLLLTMNIGRAEQVRVVDDEGEAAYAAPAKNAAAPVVKSFSTYAGRKYPKHVYWGDTHQHTSNSGDAFAAGDRLTPEDSYRFARGEEVVSSTGVPAKLSRPLDFLVVSPDADSERVIQAVNGSTMNTAGDDHEFFRQDSRETGPQET